jgi:hypothetical protein
MPQLIGTVDEVMAREKQDMLFIQLRRPFLKRVSPNPSREQHLEWFETQGLRYELVAAFGGLGEIPAYSPFNSAACSVAFETVGGKSWCLVPNAVNLFAASRISTTNRLAVI